MRPTKLGKTHKSRNRHATATIALIAAAWIMLPPVLTAVPAEPDGAIPLARTLSLKHGPLSLSAYIGDGAYGSTSGDYDWYELAVNGGWILTVDIDAEDLGSTLDSIVYIYDSSGTVLATNDDFSSPNKDSFVEFLVPQDDTYYVVVTTKGCAPQLNAFDAATGFCTPASWTHGPYKVTIAVSGVHP